MNITIPAELLKLGNLVSKHAPTILSSAGVVGVVTTTVLAVRATPTVIDEIDAFKIKMSELSEEDIQPEEVVVSPKNLVLLSWKAYLPAAVSGVLTVSAIIFAHKISLQRSAALLSAYTVTDKLYSQYKEKVEEKVGDKKHKEILDEIAVDSISKDSPNKTHVYRTNEGETLFRDSISGRYFLSDIESVRKSQNDINETIFQVNNASLNEFYESLNLNAIEIGDVLGWNTDNPLRVYFSTALTDGNKPCIVVMYENMPAYEYYSNHI